MIALCIGFHVKHGLNYLKVFNFREDYKYMKNSIDLASLLLRVVFGGFMILHHGWGKMLKLFSGNPIKFADPFGLGPEISLGFTVFAEVLCAGLIVIGFRSKLASIPLVITMLVAAFVIHGDDPFKKMESALIYAAAFAAIGMMGSGRYSVDGLLGKR